MKQLYFLTLLLITIFGAKDLCAQPTKDLSKCYPIVSASYPVPDNAQQHFADVNFKFGWSNKVPYTIAIQFLNHSYVSLKFKFAIKDVTSKKMIVLDPVHNSRFGSEMLKENSPGVIWAGLVDNIKDSFSLHVWDSDGDEFVSDPVSIKDKK